MTSGGNDVSTQDGSLEDMQRQVRATIGSGGRRGTSSIVGWSLAGIVLIAALTWWLWPGDDSIQWQQVAVTRGDMVLTATATGNLAPKSEVTVGAEISGLIREVTVAENDSVQRGMVLARFDTQELRVSLQQAQARLAVAEASVAEAEATLEEARLSSDRVRTLVTRGSASEADLDAAAAARKRASARLDLAEASVLEAEASVSAARTRLDKAIITSPIDGVVLLRNIEPGNTVAASFQAPELFLLAEDLRQMELQVSLDEADVAMVKAGQPATFAVDAWPDRQFEARVSTVYLYPSVENNVVTYTTILSVDNQDLSLQPGMTATATITTGTREQALRVPNAALRFAPPAAEGSGGMLSGPPGMQPRQRLDNTGNTLWILQDGEPTRLVVRAGYSDGRHTEIFSDQLREGDQVLVGIRRTSGGS